MGKLKYLNFTCLKLILIISKERHLIFRVKPQTKKIKDGSSHGNHGARKAVCQGFHQTSEKMHEAGPEGVLKDRVGDGRRVRHHGLHRLLRQTHPYPHQQHHRRRLKKTPLSQRAKKTLLFHRLAMMKTMSRRRDVL